MDQNIDLNKLISDQAYLYFPSNNEIKSTEGIRRIYDNVEFDEAEIHKIKGFLSYCQKHKYELSSLWNSSMILRFLQANAYKNEKTLNAIKAYSQWKSLNLIPKMTQNTQQFLNNGIAYIHGRDSRFRPIIILNAYKIETKKMDLDIIIESLTYILDFAIKHLFLPGQVENWIILIDLNKMGLSSLSLSALKHLITFLQNNYRGNLYALYIINSPSSLSLSWKMIKTFLDENCSKKISFTNSNNPTLLWNHTNKEQVEIKFGGQAKNCEVYWPPQFPSENYLLPNENPNQILKTKEQYIEKYRKGQLNNYKINKKWIIHKNDNELLIPKVLSDRNIIEKPKSPTKKMKMSLYCGEADHFTNMDENNISISPSLSNQNTHAVYFHKHSEKVFLNIRS